MGGGAMTAYWSDTDVEALARDNARLAQELGALRAAHDALIATLRAPAARTVAPARRARPGTRPDGCAPGRASGRQHARCAEHWRVPGFARAVCVLRPGPAEDGTPIGADWTDSATVLRFALDCAGRAPSAIVSAGAYALADGIVAVTASVPAPHLSAAAALGAA
jgi:hypothetical protein